VLKNIQLIVTNVHIQWKDAGTIVGNCLKGSNNDQPIDATTLGFTIGTHMEHMHVNTTDASGKLMFEKAEEQLFKSIEAHVYVHYPE